MPAIGLHQKQVATFEYDFDVDGGAIGAINLRGAGNGGANTIPDDAIICEVLTESIDAVTSAGAATIALGITGNADAFEAATAISDNSYDTAGTIDAKANELPLKTAAAVNVIATVADFALTAGKFHVHVEYLPGS